MKRMSKQKKLKLTPTQIELLKALQAGARLHYMRYSGSANSSPYYFVSGTMKHCTVAAKKLIAAGLVINRSWAPFTQDYVLSEAGKNYPA